MDFFGIFIGIGAFVIALAVTYSVGKINGQYEGVQIARGEDIIESEIEEREREKAVDDIMKIIQSVVVLPPYAIETIKSKLENYVR